MFSLASHPCRAAAALCLTLLTMGPLALFFSNANAQHEGVYNATVLSVTHETEKAAQAPKSAGRPS